MNYCPYCGEKLNQNQEVCLHCGKVINKNNKNVSVTDSGSIGWALLGFFVPIAGLILYLIWQDSYPKNAKNAGLGALISVGVAIVLTIVWFIILIFIISMGGAFWYNLAVI